MIPRLILAEAGAGAGAENVPSTTSAPTDEKPSLALQSQRQPSPRQLWNPPYAPNKASEWPDERSKEYWIGPFDKYGCSHARKARDANVEEGERLRNTRELAEILTDAGDFVGARHAWAQIADHYISEHRHTSQYRPPYRNPYDNAITHIVKASIGCILNTYLAQYPDLCVAIRADDKNRKESYMKPDPVFTAIVEFEDDLTDVRTLYTMRVMLDFAFYIEFRKDPSLMRTVYAKALEATAQIKGLDPLETIRLRVGLAHAYRDSINADYSLRWNSLSSEQSEAHRVQSTKDEVETLWLSIISDQQALWGTTAEATIDSELELVSHYKIAGDTEKARVRASQVYVRAKDHLGEDHDSTLRCLASLSSSFASTEAAGLVVHDCLTKHPGIISGSTMFLSLELSEEFVPQRGWKEMMMVRVSLETSRAPFHYVWADYRLFTLPINAITFVPRYPAATQDCPFPLAPRKPKHETDHQEACFDSENSVSIREHRKEQPNALLQSGLDLENFTSSACHVFMDLQIPYVPYQHFTTTAAFEAGMPYLEYVKVAKDLSVRYDASGEDLEMTEKQVPRKVGQALGRPGGTMSIQVEFDEDPAVTQIKGFFNNIPAESYILPELRIDLVSAQWAEYQHFSLHKLPDDASEIEITEGLSLPCRGYISGTWTDFDVCKKRKIYEVFVVDASFPSTENSCEKPLFALRQETLQNSIYHEATNSEKRDFCASLNCSLYRYQPVSVTMRSAVYKRRMAEGTVHTNMDEINLWDEMNTREKWDRNFENRKPTDDADREVLAEALKVEDERR